MKNVNKPTYTKLDNINSTAVNELEALTEKAPKKALNGDFEDLGEFLPKSFSIELEDLSSEFLAEFSSPGSGLLLNA